MKINVGKDLCTLYIHISSILSALHNQWCHFSHNLPWRFRKIHSRNNQNMTFRCHRMNRVERIVSFTEFIRYSFSHEYWIMNTSQQHQNNAINCLASRLYVSQPYDYKWLLVLASSLITLYYCRTWDHKENEKIFWKTFLLKIFIFLPTFYNCLGAKIGFLVRTRSGIITPWDPIMATLFTPDTQGVSLWSSSSFFWQSTLSGDSGSCGQKF